MIDLANRATLTLSWKCHGLSITVTRQTRINPLPKITFPHFFFNEFYIVLWDKKWVGMSAVNNINLHYFQKVDKNRLPPKSTKNTPNCYFRLNSIGGGGW